MEQELEIKQERVKSNPSYSISNTNNSNNSNNSNDDKFCFQEIVMSFREETEEGRAVG